MIDPTKITNFNRSTAELEEFWLFCLAVAGKTASQIALKIDDFLSRREGNETPFDYVRRLAIQGQLIDEMTRVKLGKYRLLDAGYRATVAKAGPCLRTSDVRELERIPGVRHKTSRFFVLHSRENADIAVIDTHVLKYLRDRGYPDIPTSVPQNDRYYEIEEMMKREVRLSGMTSADFDLAVWNHYSSKGHTPLPVVSVNEGQENVTPKAA